MAKKRTQIHYVPSTHWDREWYLPFQGFRYKLVKVVDRLLEILEADPEYRYFVFDGQTIALDDYLEIMPENRPRIAKPSSATAASSSVRGTPCRTSASFRGNP